MGELHYAKKENLSSTSVQRKLKIHERTSIMVHFLSCLDVLMHFKRSGKFDADKPAVRGI